MGNQNSVPHFELYKEWLTNQCQEKFFHPTVHYISISLRSTVLTAEKVVELLTPLKTSVLAIEYDRGDGEYHVAVVLLRENEYYYGLEMIDSMASGRQFQEIERIFYESEKLFEQKNLAKPLYFYNAHFMYGNRLPPQLEEQEFLKHCSESEDCDLKQYASAIVKHKGADSIFWSHSIARDLIESNKLSKDWSLESYLNEDCKNPFILIDIAETNANNVYKELPKGKSEEDILSYYTNLLDAEGRAPKMFDIAFKQDDGKLRSTFLGEKKKIAEGIVSFVYNDTNMRTLRNTLNNFEDKNQSERAYLLCIDKTTFEVKRCYELNVPTNAEKCFIESMPVITYDVPLDFVHKEMSGEYNNNLKDAPDNSYFVCMHTHPRFCAENDWDNLALRSLPSSTDVGTHLKIGVLQQMQYYGEECAVLDVILSYKDVFIFSTHREALKELRELDSCYQKTTIERGRLLTKWVTKMVVEDLTQCKKLSFRQKKEDVRKMEGGGSQRRVFNYFASRYSLYNRI